MREIIRKTIHLIFGLAIAIAILILDRTAMQVLLSLGLLIGFLISDAITKGYRLFFVSPLLDLVDRREALPGKGALYFVLSAWVVLTLFPVQTAFLSVLALTLVDGAATIAGRSWGRTPIFRGKTLEGSLAGATLAFLVFLIYIPPVQALLLALFAAVMEVASPVDDNLMIPLAAGVFLQLMG